MHFLGWLQLLITLIVKIKIYNSRNFAIIILKDCFNNIKNNIFFANTITWQEQDGCVCRKTFRA